MLQRVFWFGAAVLLLCSTVSLADSPNGEAFKSEEPASELQVPRSEYGSNVGIPKRLNSESSEVEISEELAKETALLREKRRIDRQAALDEAAAESEARRNAAKEERVNALATFAVEVEKDDLAHEKRAKELETFSENSLTEFKERLADLGKSASSAIDKASKEFADRHKERSKKFQEDFAKLLEKSRAQQEEYLSGLVNGDKEEKGSKKKGDGIDFKTIISLAALLF